jgi:hypothetical protein
MPTNARLTLGCILGTLLLLAGCAASGQHSTSTASVAPIHDELPNLVIREDRQTSFRAGVLAIGPQPSRRPIVPQFKPIELTDEERVALGEQEKKNDHDLLAFYTPPRSAEQGVLPFANRPDSNFYLPAVSISGVIPSPDPSGSVFFETTGQYRAAPFGRSTAATYSELPHAARSFTEGSATIGVSDARSSASRAHSLDY